MSEKITIKDIAEKADVSVGTVDRVLHNRSNVSQLAKEKVKKALISLNYHPNVYASTLAYNKSYTFVLLMPTHESEAYWEEIEQGVNKAMDSLRDFNIDVKFMYYKRFENQSFISQYEACLKEEPNGVIIVPVDIEVTKDFTNILHEKHTPLHSARLIHARSQTPLILGAGLFLQRIFCGQDADAHRFRRETNNAAETSQGRTSDK